MKLIKLSAGSYRATLPNGEGRIIEREDGAWIVAKYVRIGKRDEIVRLFRFPTLRDATNAIGLQAPAPRRKR